MELSIILPFLVILSVVLSATVTPLVRGIAFRFGAVDRPTGGRKIHQKPTALWGGLVTGGVIIAMLLCLLPYVDGKQLRVEQIVGFIVAILILLIGGMLDDKYDIPPWKQFCFPLLASIVVMASGSGIVQVTNLTGHGAFSLVWMKWSFNLFGLTPTISLPSDIITILWLLTVTYAMKFLDGLDGLVAGMTVIGGMLIAALAGSEAYFQPLIALAALLVAGVHLGFISYNREGSIFLGEAGSTIAGFSLGVLAIISGAKVATAATALAIPLMDIVLVVGRRLLRGTSPFKGDDSHLHYQLLKAGLSPRNAVRLMWGIALTFGVAALTLQTRGKIYLLIGLFAVTLVISYLAYVKAKARG
jgi:UDP-GlcNAc:undecaprenyl-phosphate/decaprenyl-phosphate GlcNAc-1-phosphate transferase